MHLEQRRVGAVRLAESSWLDCSRTTCIERTALSSALIVLDCEPGGWGDWFNWLTKPYDGATHLGSSRGCSSRQYGFEMCSLLCAAFVRAAFDGAALGHAVFVLYSAVHCSQRIFLLRHCSSQLSEVVQFLTIQLPPPSSLDSLP